MCTSPRKYHGQSLALGHNLVNNTQPNERASRVACRPEITTAVPFASARFGATAKEFCLRREYMCCDEESI